MCRQPRKLGLLLVACCLFSLGNGDAREDGGGLRGPSGAFGAGFSTSFSYPGDISGEPRDGEKKTTLGDPL